MPTRRMSYVLDTHAWIWLIGGHERAGRFKRLRRNARLLLSVVSIWETTLLHTKGRLILKPNPELSSTVLLKRSVSNACRFRALPPWKHSCFLANFMLILQTDCSLPSPSNWV